ncbi:MAG: exodeoxyribonuclease VII large subunit [Waddliaceae bacterium]|jgi:exodeoxyribonuclease VII large subunit|nr:exodeoxyribonuclease VII large subunit [Waddliaceae bacterium]MBT3578607.1 exodeoxyribonuclease VII large subunit [Waddliaceae bacterium]MBT4445533.1 exodeoxyribonuclease VII large subunit [Waddliaceae bacterium]MBT6928406.1 exodeoxyribonuclease VII large subunit [Waddliaceae bacterium]MBT7265092.1 exodeoxyribonuclease VII large subunit [Waddliaceae bacterium]
MLNPLEAITISQATQKIKVLLEGSFRNVLIRGEVSNLTNHSSGHKYFSLKDSGAQISAVMFRGDALGLKKVLSAGDDVVVRGDISVYPPRGNYQIIVREVMHAGIGEYLLKFEALKKKLEGLGWFSEDTKKALPRHITTLGIVTSPTGAAVHDIIDVARRRVPGIRVVINPVLVQGDGAAVDIAMAIQQMNEYGLADVIIVGRGGGSIEDLWPFNEEVVAKAIYDSVIPVVSAVGHETDYTIADFVSDVRAPTPSAAAEIVTASMVQDIEKITTLQKHIVHMASQVVRGARFRLDAVIKQPWFIAPCRVLELYKQRVDELSCVIDGAMRRNIEKYKLVVGSFVSAFKALNPKSIMDKGYSIVFSKKDNSVILSAKDVVDGQKLKIRLYDGEVHAITEEVVQYGEE